MRKRACRVDLSDVTTQGVCSIYVEDMYSIPSGKMCLTGSGVISTEIRSLSKQKETVSFFSTTNSTFPIL